MFYWLVDFKNFYFMYKMKLKEKSKIIYIIIR